MNHQRLGGTKSVVVYHGDSCLGEVEVFPATRNRPFFRFPGNEIRISHLSPPSERCLPHSVLHTVAPFSVKCKIQAKSPGPADLTHSSPLYLLYLSCFHQLRSAVVMLGAEELHLVALPTRLDKCLPCFWCFSAPAGLYSPCLGMLNLRCLAIVFDLDETLIVANTMKSFEDRIDAVSNRIDAEDDAVRVSGMSAELKRYLEDKALLKQYIETDTVLSDNGRLLTVQIEEVPPLTSNHTPFVRPIIRLQEKNVILTRINPEIRDTSVLVRLRPAWEDLRNYLTAKGRKRFEVYVCTMAERDYALEMWRLLDPEANLISSNQLLDRIVCVKSGSRKSLDNVFQGGSCHPKMSMVIDDRLKVWEDRDQPRVHVVPAFAPYYAPQAETANIVPVLCVARNVACNVRGAFFKEFDENLLRRAFELHYEEEMQDFPLPPDTSDYLMTEDTNTTINGNRDMPISEGISGAETEKRLNQPVNVSEDEQAQHKVEPVQHKVEPAQQKVEPTQQKVDNSCLPDDINQVSISNKNYSNEDGSGRSTVSITVLHEIGRKCGCKIEFKSVTSSIKDLQFAVEVLFSNEKIGLGMGRTKKEAQIQASVNALSYLANHYKEFTTCDDGLIVSDLDENSLKENNGFLDEEVSDASDVYPKKVDLVDTNSAPEPVPLDDAERLAALVSGIKELLSTNEGHNLVFREQPPTSVTLSKGEYYSQLETTGQILGKGICKSREGAKLQAADDALRSLKVVGDHVKHLHSPRTCRRGRGLVWGMRKAKESTCLSKMRYLGFASLASTVEPSIMTLSLGSSEVTTGFSMDICVFVSVLPQVGSRKRSREEFAGQ